MCVHCYDYKKLYYSTTKIGPKYTKITRQTPNISCVHLKKSEKKNPDFWGDFSLDFFILDFFLDCFLDFFLCSKNVKKSLLYPFLLNKKI